MAPRVTASTTALLLLALAAPPVVAQGETGAPSDEVAAAASGVATSMWLRSVAAPTTLWLFVDGLWRRLDDPPYAVQDAVEEAFAPGSRLETFVGYDDATSTINFVVVRSKEEKPPAVVAKVVDMMPATLSGETFQDSEPFLSVDLTDPNIMVGSAFTRNPNPAETGRAPAYLSTDGGDTWVLCTMVPSAGMTSDITIAGSLRLKRLYGGILKRPGSLLMNILQTNDSTDCSTAMSEEVSRGNVDQPFVQARRVGSADQIYVGSNDFGVADDKTATIDYSLDDGATYQTVRIEPRSTAGQNGPSIRPAVAGNDQTVYAAYFGWRTFDQTTGIATSDVVVVRDDDGGAGVNPFRDLTDPADSQAGRIVAKGVTIPWSNAPTLGFERIGSTLSIAVDPTSSDTVYLGWADRKGDGDIYTIHVRRSTDRGATWSNDLRTVRNATPFALAVAGNSTVGLLYQQFTGSGAGSKWVTHLEQTRDGFATVVDTVLANVAGDAPPFQFLPYIGDYNFLLGMGDEFRGIFSTSNLPDRANFPAGVTFQRSANFDTGKLLDGAGNEVAISIDPFYFRVPAIR